MLEKMKTKNIFVFVLIVLCIVFYHGNSQENIPDLSNVKNKTTHVAGNIYMLEATGDVAGNIAVSAGPDGILLVDTQFAPLSDLILAELKNITVENIKFIVNTHHHADHTHGNMTLGKSPIIIPMHKNGYCICRVKLNQR